MLSIPLFQNILLRNGNKTISGNCGKVKTSNTFFTSVFKKETDTFHTLSKNNINSISFTRRKRA